MTKPKARTYTVIEPGNGWRERLKDFKVKFTDRDLDEVNTDIENKVYAMALDGVALGIIADYFGVDRGTFEKLYQPVHKAGRAELQALIARETVDYGMNSKMPVAKIWLGKSLGGLTDGGGGVDVDVTSADSGDIKLNINVVKREREDNPGEAS